MKHIMIVPSGVLEYSLGPIILLYHCPVYEVLRSHLGCECAEAEERGEEEFGPAPAGFEPFTKLQPRALEALRYRGEDIARSLTKQAVREVWAIVLPIPAVLSLGKCQSLLEYLNIR
jgi:hypothetical protein